MNTRELIDAIYSGDENANEIFLDNFSSRVTNRLEVMKVDVASSLLDDLDAEQMDEAAPIYNVRQGGRVIGTHSADRGFRSSRPGENKSQEGAPNVKNIRGATVDHKSGPVATSPKKKTSLKKDIFRALDRAKMAEDVEQVDEALESEFKNLGTRRNDTGRELEDADYQEHYYDSKGIKPQFKRPKSNRYKMLRKAAKMKEDVEQIDELSKDLRARYINAAATNIRTSTKLAGDFEDDKYRHMRVANKNSPNVYTPGYEKDPAAYADAKQRMDAAASIEADFRRAVKNRIRGIGRATRGLAREEVDQMDEAILDQYGNPFPTPATPPASPPATPRLGRSAKVKQLAAKYLSKAVSAAKGPAARKTGNVALDVLKIGGASLGTALSIMAGNSGNANDIMSPDISRRGGKGKDVWHVGPNRNKDPEAQFPYDKENEAKSYAASKTGYTYWKGKSQ